MSRSGVKCPCCGTIMTMDDIKAEGQGGRLGSEMTAVVVEGQHGKEYRRPMTEEFRTAVEAEQEIDQRWEAVPFGLPRELIAEDAKRNTWCIKYGLDRFHRLFTPRQILALGIFVNRTRTARKTMESDGYPSEWVEAIGGYLALATDRLADYSSALCTWHNSGEKMRNTFGRFALPIMWDYAEVEPTSRTSGSYFGAVEWISRFIGYVLSSSITESQRPVVDRRSATQAYL